MLATACVYDGKWQYEATIGTAGIQQLGWAVLTCPFTNEEGVGDSPDSYAYDGKRQAKWHEGSDHYGEAWAAGDIIGSCIDLESGTIAYYRNGVSMGVAFTRVRKGLGYFPAISLSYGEKCSFNFGRRPFEYPVEGFAPLQPEPVIDNNSNSSNSSYLIGCLRALLNAGNQLQQPTSDDIHIAASILFEYLIPFTQSEYYVAGVWYPFLVSLSVEGSGSIERLIQWMQLFMEDFEWKQCMGYLLQYIGFKCRTTGVTQAKSLLQKESNRPEKTHYSALALLVDLLHYSPVLDFAKSFDGIFSLLELFVTFKPPSKNDLAKLLPYVWWQGGEGEATCSESHFLHDMGLLNEYVRVYDDLVYDLIVLLHNAEDTPQITTSTSVTHNEQPKKNSWVHHWLHFLIAKNKGANRNVVPLGLSSSSVLVNVYFSLLRILFPNQNVEFKANAHLDGFSRFFCKETGIVSEFSRLGGTLGHLQKTVPKDELVPAGAIDGSVEMMDAAIILYHLGVSSRFKTSSQQQNTVLKDLAQLKDAKTGTTDTTLLVTKVVDGLRIANYSRAVLMGDKVRRGHDSERNLVKQEIMYKKTVFLAELITLLSQQGSKFSFVPEYYMESMVDCFHSLRRAVPALPLTTEAPYSSGLKTVLTSLIMCFNDTRIVNPDVKDLLLQSLGVLMQYGEYVTFVEQLDERVAGDSLQEFMLRGLLQTFDKKFWVTVTTILLRFWKGFGLDQTSTPASSVFRNAFDTISVDKDLLTSFLNHLFNFLNSTISEFFVMKLDGVLSPNDTRKANFLFELSINLLRILEFISLKKPELLLTEINLMRLVELLLLILTRTILAPESSRLDGILVLEPHVSRSWILVPLIGILLNLDNQSQDSSHSLYDALLSDASFKVEAFDALLTFSWKQVPQPPNWLKSFETFVERIKLRQQEIEKKSKENTASGVPRSTSIDLCSICYSAPIDTRFDPCKHSSCHRCISRHLLNNSRCFFCNADVTSTHPL